MPSGLNEYKIVGFAINTCYHVCVCKKCEIIIDKKNEKPR